VLDVCLSVCLLHDLVLDVCLSVCLLHDPVLDVCLSVCLSVCYMTQCLMSVWRG